MGYKRASKALDLDLRVQKAVSAYHNQEFTSIRAAATHFQISDRTLARRIAGGKSRAQAREITQLLSNAEEKTLVRWITRYTCAGFLISPALLKELAKLIQHRRVRHASQNNYETQIINLISNE